jgi:hypothetical protein
MLNKRQTTREIILSIEGDREKYKNSRIIPSEM